LSSSLLQEVKVKVVARASAQVREISSFFMIVLGVRKVRPTVFQPASPEKVNLVGK